ncbi:MAG: hypothetical protein ACJA1B_000642 [Polaribacter sp.]|jgi:hypothetical protein
MKKIYTLLFTIIFLSACNTSDDLGLSTDKVVADWNLVSQIIDGQETATDCTKQTVFSFKANRVLTQTFYNSIGGTCSASPQIVSNWFFSGNSQYRVESSNGTIRDLVFIFSENNTKFTLTEADTNGQVIISTFVKII